MRYQRMATLVHRDRQLQRVGQFQAMACPQTGRQHGDIRIDGAQAPAGIGGQKVPITLGEGVFARLQWTTDDFGERDRRHQCLDTTGVDRGENRLKRFAEGVAFQQVDDRIGVDQYRGPVRNAGGEGQAHSFLRPAMVVAGWVPHSPAPLPLSDRLRVPGRIPAARSTGARTA